MPTDDRMQASLPGAAPPPPRGARPLAAGEIALAEAAFGNGIDYGRVRMRNGPGFNPIAFFAFMLGNPAITLVATLYFKGRYCADFSAAAARDKMLFMHEMTHVWQYRALGVAPFFLRYARELAACGFRRRALYAYVTGETPFGGATLEAQAEMVGDYQGAMLSGDEAGARWIAKNLAGSGLFGQPARAAEEG